MTKQTLYGAALALALGAGCNASDVTEAVVPFEELVVDPGFTFQTTSAVRLRIEMSEDVVVPVEVLDGEGRRLYQGGVRANVDLQLGVPDLAAPTLTVRAGRGADAVVRTLDIQNGRAVTQL